MTLAITFMIVTMGVLVVGIIFMAIGGNLDKKYSNKLMSLRVLFQALALVALGLMFFLSRH